MGPIDYLFVRLFGYVFLLIKFENNRIGSASSNKFDRKHKMTEDWSMQNQKIACGQYHSAFIGTSDAEKVANRINISQLYVWGNNEEGQLSNYIPTGKSKFMKKLEKPERVPLMFGQREYEAISVSAGPNYNLIIGRVNLDYEREKAMQGGHKKNKQKMHFKSPLIMPNDEKRFKDFREETRQKVELIREILRNILQRKGTLYSLFQAADVDQKNYRGAAAQKQKDQNILAKYNKKKEGGYSQFYKEDRTAKNFKPQVREDGMKTNDGDGDPASFTIEYQDFIEKLNDHDIAHVDDINTVAEAIYGDETVISLQQLEDFSLGFQQDAIKLFMYGKCDAKLFSFNKKLPIVNPKSNKKAIDDGDTSSSNDEDPELNQTKMSIITRPTVITFPKFCPQIVQVSCGVGHILALTSHYDMYSWGNGEYGALGFGSIQSIAHPTPLNLKQNGIKLQITRVECGAQHSMCITHKKQLFSWGCGKQGRLGLGNEEDLLHPTEITMLSNLRVIQVSAGESHCAAITQAGKVYLWGNGSYGRLGTGFEMSISSPQIIPDLSNRDIVRVSCGAYHTFLISKDGILYAFGQNKYGKLGLNVRKENTVFRSTQARIIPFNINFMAGHSKKVRIEEDPGTQIWQVVAGYNHSMAVTSRCEVYTWGYPGFGILGRQGVENIPLCIEAGIDGIKKRFKVNLTKKVLELIQENSLQQASNSLVDLTKKLSTRVDQVQCVSLGTMIKTDSGDIYYAGDERYGQMTLVEEQDTDFIKAGIDPIFKRIKMPHKVKFIACGGDHIFAVTTDEKVYGWGRNDAAQLGLGVQQDYLNVPSEVPAFRDIIVTKIVCGSNYSAAITTSANLMVAGSMEYGKLGLGSNQRSGYTQEFTQVPRIKSVKDVACGPTHMLAIVSQNASSGCGVFAWGNNYMGQLGLNSTDTSYVPKEITSLKKSERFSQVCAGADFSLGISKQKVFMWGNAKYYGASTSSSNRMHKTPILVKDLESHKIRNIFCSQTYAVAITDNYEVKIWGEWLYEKAQKEMAGLDVGDEAQDAGNQKQSEGDEQRSENSSGSQNSSESNEEDDKYYQSEESDQDEDQGNRANNNKQKDQDQEFFKIQSFPDSSQKQLEITAVDIAFGAEHAVAVSKDGLLFSWGMNQVQQCGISLIKYQENMEDKNPKDLMNKLHPSSINPLLEINKNRENEEKDANGNQDGQEDDDSDSDRRNSVQEQDVPPGEKQESQNAQTNSTESASEESGEEGDQPAEKGPDKKSEKAKPIERQEKIADPNQIELIEKSEAHGFGKPKQIEDFPKIKPEKRVKIYNSAEQQGEQKMETLQKYLLTEKKSACDEESLFHLDKNINEALGKLLKTVAKLPEIQRQRRQLKVMIKNAFMQRISEKPLAVPPAVDWNDINAGKYVDRQNRKIFKPNLQQILNILHSHPCFMINMYVALKPTGEPLKVDDSNTLLSYLKILYPTQVFSNFQLGPKSPNLDSAIMVSREQERVNLNLISFIKKTIKLELQDVQSLKDVDFLKESSLIGKLFYRILKSQERNMDTICCMLAHLMNKFIQSLQEGGAEFDAGSKQDAARGNKSKDPNANAQFEYSTKACEMYFKFVTEMADEILKGEVLSNGNSHFSLKKVWLDEDGEHDKNKSVKIDSLRFSGEIGLLCEIIYQELNLLKGKDKRKQSSKSETHEEQVAAKILGLIFHPTIKKISESQESLKLYLYPYLRETKKQILIDEGMQKQGQTFLELCKVVQFFFSNQQDEEKKTDWANPDFPDQVKRLRTQKIVTVLSKFRETNNLQPKLLPVKHFESGMFHSLSPYDFQLNIKKNVLVELLNKMFEHREDISLMKPVTNDQLFRLFGVTKEEKNDSSGQNKGKNLFSDFINIVKTYNDKFVIKIPSRQFVNNRNPSVQKCKDCEAVLTDDFVKLEGQPIIDQYEPEDKESLVSVYCDILRNISPIDPTKNTMVQINDASLFKNSQSREGIAEKIKDFQSMMDREIQSQHDKIREITIQGVKGQSEEIIADKYMELKGRRVVDWHGFETLLSFDDTQNEAQKVDSMLDGLTRVWIEDHILLKNSQDKINQRLSHKNINKVLQRRMETDLKSYLDQAIRSIEQHELFQLKLQLLNSQLGLGNSELRKLTKNSDQVTQMKGILNQQRNQKYSQILYRVLPDRQKMALRAIVQKPAKDLIKNKTITEIKVKSLRPMINSCKLQIMEDERRDVLVKLLYEKKTSTCLCFNSSVIENLLLQFHLSQQEILNLRKYVQKYQAFEMHVMLAFDQGSFEQQQKVSAFANRMAGNIDDSKSDKKKKGGDKKTQKKKAPDTKESALAAIQFYNRRTFKDCIEFDLTKLVGLINDMLRTRYSYIFNSDRTPEQLLRDNEDLI